jgi:hypothetical protein
MIRPRVLLLLLVATVAPAFAATTAVVWNASAPGIAEVETIDCPPVVGSSSCAPNATGIPDQPTIDAVRDGTYSRIRFVPTSALFVNACGSLVDCVDAIAASCSALGDDAYESRVAVGKVCSGTCQSGNLRSRFVRLVCAP